MHNSSTTRFADSHARWWSTAGQDTRRWAFYELGAMMCAADTGKVHSPTAEDSRQAILARRERRISGDRARKAQGVPFFPFGMCAPMDLGVLHGPWPASR